MYKYKSMKQKQMKKMGNHIKKGKKIKHDNIEMADQASEKAVL